MKKLVLLTLVLSFMGSVAHALDKKKLASHIRQSLSLDPRQTITVGDPEPSKFKGIKAVTIKVGRQSQEVYLLDDGNHYILGTAFDLRINPDKDRWSKIDLKNGTSQGSPKAKVKLVEYSDLQCGYCRKAHFLIKEELYKKYTKNQVQLVFKHFPLSGHKWAEPGAVALECAKEQKETAYWSMMDKFFNDSAIINPENVKAKSMEYASQLKLKRSKFKRCLDSEAVRSRVQSQKKEGLEAGVTSTPSFVINGRLQRGIRNFDTLSAIIDEKLAE